MSPSVNRPRHDSMDSILGDDTTQSTPMPKIKSEEHTKKKPGPKPTKTPLMKNDMKAKIAVIKEIESFWGRGFIKRYIPQCHRPLVKRPPGTTRNIPRFHEEDPKKWKPSVLKAIRMICEKTDDHLLVKKLMGEVIGYRNKNTGNKKPEVVTTDFDVIEDVVEKGWAVPQSFAIRYKHLLAAQPGRGEAGENNNSYYDDDAEEDGNDGADIRMAEDGSEEEQDARARVSKFFYPPALQSTPRRTTNQEMRALGQHPLPPFQPSSRTSQTKTQPRRHSSYHTSSTVLSSDSDEPLAKVISERRRHLPATVTATAATPSSFSHRDPPRTHRRADRRAAPSVINNIEIKNEPDDGFQLPALNFGMSSNGYNASPTAVIVKDEQVVEDFDVLEAEMQVAEANARQARLRLELIKRRRSKA
ncbi:hypothetical protein P154DRAFT_564701 [Amniculicola lignicola CBS 123094]|uniref:Uncharacterized protein n=1 Tax=Amniculicola lignicola CBS 123094 TaxID=1392246 RepID=A0A6A5WH96_9PLEO|nr:hypothetical protein P154DRAFT_564701 [Amniculicola lignicola CBS 123094]